ncbi:MAG: hypothetical protein JWM80_280 [Cyanobacteria bacterium RYN_339]|nr:hypothetical protein [Cyanobacteria bacterium RYN_339]
MEREDFNRLGQLLIRSGHINNEQLAMALEQQKTTNQKLGELMVVLGYVSQDAVNQALETQSRISFTMADAGPRPHS